MLMLCYPAVSELLSRIEPRTRSRKASTSRAEHLGVSAWRDAFLSWLCAVIWRHSNSYTRAPKAAAPKSALTSPIPPTYLQFLSLSSLTRWMEDQRPALSSKRTALRRRQCCLAPMSQAYRKAHRPALRFTQVLRQGSEALRQGSEALRQGSEALRQGCEALRQGSGACRQGSGACRQGSGACRQGSEALRQDSGRLWAFTPSQRARNLQLQ